MKPRTFFGLALLVPYILWGICAVLVAILSASQVTSATLNILLMPIIYYTFGVYLWGIPYTILSVGLWLWSRNRSISALYKLATRAPLLLFVLVLIETVFVFSPMESSTELIKNMIGISILLGVFSLVFGYLCVGIALGAYKLLRSKNFIIEAETPAPIENSAAAINAQTLR